MSASENTVPDFDVSVRHTTFFVASTETFVAARPPTMAPFQFNDGSMADIAAVVAS